MIEGLLLKPYGSAEVRSRRWDALDDAQVVGSDLRQELRRCTGPGFGRG
jgi:hypothetical protein